MAKLINPEEVRTVLKECFYNQEELKNGKPENIVIAEGITRKFGFNPIRLEEKRSKVIVWLEALPRQFHKDGGGGWSFLNMCNQADEVRWTDSQQCMEELLCLGLGLGLIRYCMPREFWGIHPGSVPYLVICTPEKK